MTHTPTLLHRDFILVVFGQIISLFGNAILRFALPLYLLRETGSSTLFGLVIACSFLPMIVLSLLGGVLADRVNKRNIMVILDFGTALLIIAFSISLGRFPTVILIIITLMLLYGISGVYQPAVQASLPLLVPPDKLLAGNAIINQVNTLSGLLGPIIGGILFGLWGIYPLLLLSAACFAFSAAMELFIHIPYARRSASASLLATTKNDLQESWLFIKKERPIFIPVILILAAFNLALSPAMIVGIPVMVINILRLNDAALGLAQGIMGLGGFIGGLLTGLFAAKLQIGCSHLILRLCSLTAAIMGLALLPIVPPLAGYSLLLAMSLITMAVSTMFTIQMFTLIQQQTPPHLVGKIMASIIAAAMCTQPLGQAIYGLLFDWWAALPWLVMLVSASAAFIISLFARPIFSQLESQMPVLAINQS